MRSRDRYQRGPSTSGAPTGGSWGDGRAPGGIGVNDVTTPRGYGIGGHGWWRSDRSVTTVTDGAVVAVAAVTAAAVSHGSVRAALVLALLFIGVKVLWSSISVGSAPPAAGRARWWLVALVPVLAVAGALRSQHAWAALAPDTLGQFDGWVTLVDDPQPYPASTRVIVEVDGERFEIWARGRAQQQRLRAWRGGERIAVSGVREALDPERAQRVAWQHVVGEFDLAWASDVDAGGPVARASNRVRSAIERAAEVLPEPDGALYRGLVIGDDRDQPRDMVERFRASGLSHLTAVSGQNVAFVLAACGPLLVRLRPLPRWALTVAVIGWFVVLTRVEPSILRAGVMAGLSATAYLTGRERSPVRLLGLAVIGLVLVDPLLAWSIGFWLSVGATAGVCTVGPWLAERLSFLGPLALPLGVTLGAQLGVVIPSVWVFGRLPLVSIVANLLAVPVAGAVMLYGLPAGLVAGAVPALAPMLMFPARVGTRWVDTVATLGARLEPDPPWVSVGWGVVVAAVVLLVAWSVCRPRAETR
jgi:competence protein ComEC